MELLDTSSLAKTIENVSESLFFGFDIPENEKRTITEFLVSRHYEPGAYADMFAPTPEDMKREQVLFTGEKIKTNAGRSHVMGEEAGRILRKLGVENDAVGKALREADCGIQSKMKEYNSPFGTYCCKTCSCALWLNLASGGLGNNTEMLGAGLNFLKQHREEKGKWRSFPYYYTLYVLNEIGPDLALDEMRFATKSIERWVNRKSQDQTKFSYRRQVLGEKILSVV